MASANVQTRAETLWLTTLRFLSETRNTTTTRATTEDEAVEAVSKTHRLFKEREQLVAAMRQELGVDL